MGATERRKGNRAELAVVHALRRAGFKADTSRSVSGVQGGDDVITDAPVSIEVKDRATLDLSGWIRQAESNANGRPAVVWHKRRGHANAEDWYVTMTGAALVALLQRATYRPRTTGACECPSHDSPTTGPTTPTPASRTAPSATLGWI